ncbi:palmitoyl-acyl carrier protein thioesterase [Spatholobus suberectus]|nr:palmitoyl-acyl carrier protein thioesterase [Spatholobus suberectus]
MAPHGESLVSSFSRNNNISKPPKLSSENLQRTVSDISFELTQQEIDDLKLPPISEVENAKCECCGMCEECTPEYIDRVREKFTGKWVCGLCAEAVKEEQGKNNGGKMEEALSAHMSACVRFNKYGRAFPVLFQAQAMKEMLKKNTLDGRRAKSISPRDKGVPKKGGIARSTSCIAAITREINDIKIVN